MDRAKEIGILKQLLHYNETGTTAMADAPWENPVSAYSCPERHRLEEEKLIRGRPVVMGLSADWPENGSYRTDDLTGVPILIVRGRDGLLRAFLNVCRHRGAKVVDGCGTARSFRCPYHAWLYADDGELRAVPEEHAFEGALGARHGLTSLPLAEKYGMVWVLPTPAADGSVDLDIDPWLGGLEEDLKFWKLDTYHFHSRHAHYEDMNYKLLVDTFLEGYHFGFLHADTLRGVLKPHMNHFETFGPNSRTTYARAKIDRLPDSPEEKWDLMWNSTIVTQMMANTVFSPQGDHMEIYRCFPVDGRPDRSVMEMSLYIPKPVETEDEKRHWDANMALALNVITTEDFPASRTMQLGFGSGAQQSIVFGRNEPALIHYHQSIRQALGLDADEVPAAVE